MAVSGWIGVDLDGTLAYYDEWRGHKHIGEPIMPMLQRVKNWINQGVEVRIFTARVSGEPEEAKEVNLAVQDWLLKHGLPMLRVTCTKDYAMLELWDDRAVQVQMNIGRPVGYSTRGFA